MKAHGKHYPLVVKLGTISAKGADVYSYSPDEDDMVEDPYLAEHLRHWGINMVSMEKTEKSMAELQIELNKGFEFDKITEAGSKLESAHGPRLVGLKNMGNTCYLNSVIQALKQVPAVCDRYFDKDEIFSTAPENPVTDFPTQMSKLINALVSDEYATPRPRTPQSLFVRECSNSSSVRAIPSLARVVNKMRLSTSNTYSRR